MPYINAASKEKHELRCAKRAKVNERLSRSNVHSDFTFYELLIYHCIHIFEMATTL